MPRPSAKDRARAYIAKAAPASIQGTRNRNTYTVACALMIEFGLNESDGWDLILEYNRAKCAPPLDEHEVATAFHSACRMADSKPRKEIGRLLDEDRRDYTGPRSPTETAAPSSAPKPPGQAPSKVNPSAARTFRTPVFPVHRFGEGAKLRTVRTLRTLPAYSFTQTPTLKPIRIDSGRASEVSVIKALPVSANQLHQPRQTVQTLADQARESGHDLTWCDNATEHCVRYDMRGQARVIGTMAKDRKDE
jgi:hypothetical protein